MLAHVFAWSKKTIKTLENYQKSTSFIIITRDSHKAHAKIYVFFIVFDHANACTSMRSLVEIHNKGKIGYLSLPFIPKMPQGIEAEKVLRITKNNTGTFT